VGNEPDLANADAWVARWAYLDTAKNAIPNYRWLSNLKWMASMPTKTGRVGVPGQDGFNYSNIMYSMDSDGTVQDRYDGLGVHSYGYGSLDQSYPGYSGDGNNPLAEMEYALARLPVGKVIHVTEAGINSSATWGTKGGLFKNAAIKGSSLIRSWTFFCLTQDATWNTNGLYYAIDCNYGGVTPTAGRPCATSLAGR
ncbi:MAG TPA: hypothetical protein VHS28_06900, partial [Chloroflexota bacterium]|nr:hypothetical protein [Chloroflexota bacterium]